MPDDFFTALSFTLAAPRLAHADDAAVAEAKARFSEGVQLADAGKHEEARLKFQQAAAVLKAAAVLYNLARAEQLTGHEFEAIEHYRQFLRFSQNDPTIKDEQRQMARSYVAELSPRVGQVDIEAPPSARVSIDGKPLEEPPKEPVAVQPGRHVIEAAFEGKLRSVTVECEKGKVVKAKIEFEAGGTEPPREDRSGGWSTAKTVTVAALGASALAGIGVGVGFALSSQSAKTDENAARVAGVCVDQSSDSCNRLKTARDSVDSKATISTVGYIAGGVLLLGAVIAAVVWPRTAETALSVGVAPQRDGGELYLNARF